MSPLKRFGKPIAILVCTYIVLSLVLAAQMAGLIALPLMALRLLALAWILSLLSAGGLAISCLPSIFKYDLSRFCEKRAQQIAGRWWYVKGVGTYEDIGYLFLQTADKDRLGCGLHYSSMHPDWDKLDQLKNLDRLRFKLTETSFKTGSSETDFLQIEEIINWS